MEQTSIKQYEELSPFLTKYPKAAGSLFQTYNDLKLSTWVKISTTHELTWMNSSAMD